jgi:hypothetical protein
MSKKIIIRLNGGLGNQLFQYAFARSIAKQRNSDFKLDTKAFSPKSHRYDPYGLDAFTIRGSIASQFDLYGFIWLRKNEKLFSFFYDRLRFKKIISGTNGWYYKERMFFYDPIVFSSRAKYFDGFWQSEKYFKNIADEIRSDITLKAPLSAQSQKYSDSIVTTQAVSLHVRRFTQSSGGASWNGLCTLEYYEQAIAKIISRIPDAHFYIFSDEPAWVKENLLHLLVAKSHPFTLIQNGKDKSAEDLILMSRCKHHIIANSSFSWWGSWLNPRKDKIVIAPRKWFNNAPKNDTRDLYIEEWVKI